MMDHTGGASRTLVDDAPFWLRREWRTATGKTAFALFTATGLSFLATVIAARSLGPSSYGVVVLSVSTVTSVASFLDFSFEEAVVHFGAQRLVAGDRSGLRSLLRLSFRLDVGVGLLVFGSLMLLASPVADVVSGGRMDPIFLQLAAFEALATTLNGTSGAALLLSGRPELRAWAMTWTGLLRLIAVLFATSFGLGAGGVLGAYAVGSALGAACQGLLASHTGRHRSDGAVASKSSPEPVHPGRLIAFGFHSSLTTSLIAIRLAVVSVILARSSGSAEVAVLSVAMFPIMVVSVLSAPLRITMIPEQAELAARGRWDVLRRAVRSATILGLGVGVVGALAGWFALPRLIPWLYSSPYREAIGPARILLGAAAAGLAVAWSKGLPAAVGRPGIRTVMSIAELAVTALVVMWLADRGATGAAVAICITSGLIAIAWVVVAHRLLGTESREHELLEVASDG